MKIPDAIQVASPNISIWLSRLHLVLFGLIPYIITFAFNLILIHHLRSGPFHRQINFNSRWSYRSSTATANSRYSPRILNFIRGLSRGGKPRYCSPKHPSSAMSVQISPTIQLRIIPRYHSCPVDRDIVLNASKNVNCEPSLESINLQERITDMSVISAIPEMTARKENTEMHEMALVCFEQEFSKKKKCKIASIATSFRKETRKQVRLIPVDGFWVGQTRTTCLLLTFTFTFIGLTLPYLIYTELKQVSIHF